MGILSDILGKIFPSSHAANPSATPAAVPPTAGPAGAASAAPVAPPPASQPTGGGMGATAPQPMTQVDVEQMLNEMAARSSEKLNWRTSIVDLMKLLGLDSSLGARKELAQELHYTGDTNDSAAMNVWLHRQVMNKVAANGGKVPADLRD
ncbi:hypothetical protein GCM10007320_63530 [Pseudorhodoferax aquiterrae]|uniref:DUF3597 domain-containing protein n=1 Tax=Pseudorhodoferax aquiterrae TaxID=747304 RepID=A0ABQ3GEG0_9BURK|nr:DUF3597 domain-containing protein [Pseudorhodoferax aquiterrae]GHD03452.1 hypothetical protein GCM10007320_63530 [Pseudorhodoferax aquiterrae]